MGSKTKTGVLLGTPGYMSPEQIKNSKGVDPRSDLWSVGIILYEMLTGREAFTADNEFQRLTMVLTQEVRPIGEVAPQLASWTAFFQRALSKDLARRFQSAQEMSQGLAAMLTPRGQSAPGAQAGTVALSLGSPSMHQPYGAPHSAVHAQPSAVPGTMGSPGQGSPGQGSPGQGSHGQGSHGQGSPAGQWAPQGHAHAQGPASAPVQQQPYARSVPPPPNQMPSVPPPGSAHPQGPSTQFSAQRPPGVPTLTSGSAPPAVDLLVAPPVGVPWWVVGAVGAACLVLGFIAGFLAK